MARDDIMPWDSANGGTSRTNVGYIAATEEFERGEPVRVEEAGTITECADDPTALLFLGIAANGPGHYTTAPINPRTNKYTGTQATWPVNTRVEVWIPSPGDKFITTNYAATAGGGFGDVAPTGALIGDEIGINKIGNSWGLAADATNNICRVYDVLNANKDSIMVTGETLTASTTQDSYYVVFEFVGHMSLPITGVASDTGA